MTAEKQTTHCLSCERSAEQVPLLTLNYRGGVVYICPQCLPILIHKPQQLASKLPGMETVQTPKP